MNSVEEKNTNSANQYIICPICKGSGLVQGVGCTKCNGKSLGVWQGDRFYFWKRNFSKALIYQKEVQQKIKQLIDLLLIIIGFSGLGLLIWFISYSVYLYYDDSGLSIWQHLLTPDWRMFLFWITVLSDLYYIYRKYLESQKKEVISRKGYNFRPVMGPSVGPDDISKIESKKKTEISKFFSEEAMKTVEHSYLFARKFKHGQIQPVHLLAALFDAPRIRVIFGRLGIDGKKLVSMMGHKLVELPRQEGGESRFSPEVKKIFITAYSEAYISSQNEVDVDEILIALIKGDELSANIFYELEVDLDKACNVVAWLRSNDILIKSWQKYKKKARFKPKGEVNRAYTSLATPLLDSVGEDLTLLAKYGYLAPAIDRKREQEEIFRIIESGAKSVILVGNPGVGKESIVEGIAQRMVTEDVPEIMQDKRLVSLSIPKLVSGLTYYKAAGKLSGVIREVVRSGNIVLSIKNIQDLIGAGSVAEEGVDLSKILYDAIEKYRIIVIASASVSDYARYIERSALGQELNVVKVDEPDVNSTIQIVEAKTGLIESKTHVYFSYSAIEDIVRLTKRYIHDRFLPEKAILMLEEIAIYTKKKKGENSVVTPAEVREIISGKTGVPVTSVTSEESEKLMHLEDEIHKRIVDQEEAVDMVASAVRRARAELRDTKRPIVNLLFLGPTGVGKTEVSKTVASVYFGSEKNMIRLDMSEFQEQASIDKMIGGPSSPQGGYLTEAVRKNPFSLVLLDEIEKAHPEILNLFLQVMDDGRLTDNHGTTIDFTNVILIATSNAGTVYIQDEVVKKTPLEKIKQNLMNNELRSSFRPEFLNRFDGIVVFKPLTMEDVKGIARILMNDVVNKLEEKGIILEYTEQAINDFAGEGFDEKFGARPLRRLIQEKVDDSLAEAILTGKLARRDTVILETGETIRIKKAEKL